MPAASSASRASPSPAAGADADRRGELGGGSACGELGGGSACGESGCSVSSADERDERSDTEPLSSKPSSSALERCGEGDVRTSRPPKATMRVGILAVKEEGVVGIREFFALSKELGT